MNILTLADIILFAIFLINVAYLFVFSAASLFGKKHPIEYDTRVKKRIAILIPSYKEDAVIMECVESCMAQEYPNELYDTVVISDHMTQETNEALCRMSVKLVEVYFENSTKSKALNRAMEEIGDRYDVAIILDADNIIAPDFLLQINNKFHEKGIEIVQAHRCAKNLNNPLAFLDALSEEINNSIFRKGHANLGLSAALIGSGMAFDYQLFKKTMLSIDAVGGFDRALELSLLAEGKRIAYLPYVDVLDEKVQRSTDFVRQRRRWMSAQLHYLSKTLKYVPGAIKNGRWDFCDKVFQQAKIPRIILLGCTFILSVGITLFSNPLATKWWLLLGILIASLFMAIPKKLYRKEFIGAAIRLPRFFVLMIFNLFRMKGANKTFIHTQHGINNK